ncbi:hypothetical protein Q5P01_009000 [Channa striata]|uniref:SAM-dependent MTase RsmB/NOP-type domain-containing protein n=1 Tax=Channa striata TaxID=64152 RepID=A0AA88SS58_CHASR|nr:hypothetical protein Q5P01_009000 [Channa striata]
MVMLGRVTASSSICGDAHRRLTEPDLRSSQSKRNCGNGKRAAVRKCASSLQWLWGKGDRNQLFSEGAGQHSETMVRTKKPGGRPNRPSTIKSKKTASPIAISKDLTPLDDPVCSVTPLAFPELQTCCQDQLEFPDKVYLLAAAIFLNNHMEKPAARQLVNYGGERGIALPELKDEEMQRWAYELAFNSLKYQELLEDIMIDSGFYFTQLREKDQMALVAVTLYDFQDRKFLPWEHQGEEDIIQEVRDVKNNLLRFKTKLAASLARCRIKHDLLSIECILPESVKIKQERSSSLPLYAWINTLRSSHDEVQSILKSGGFSEVRSVGQLEGQSFCQDVHCRDMLVFPASLKAQLYYTTLISDHKLIIQDKACSLGPYAVCSLLPEEGDVLMVGCFSGLTILHTASLIAEKCKSNSNHSQHTIYVCVSDRTDGQREELQQAVSAMGCKNVKLISEVFQSLSGGDKRLQKVSIILLTPKCSLSAVSNPVEFILQENGDIDLLQDLSHGSVAQSKLEALVAQQTKDIDHALKFPKVMAVVYSTYSSHSEENEKLVNRALDQAHSQQEGEPKQANFRPDLHLFSSFNQAAGSGEAGPFFMLEPSDISNGCFLAVLTREPEPEIKESPQEILARANAKGLLDKINCNQPTRKEHSKHTKKMKKTSCAHAAQSHLSVNVPSKHQDTKGSNNTPLCGHHKLPNRQMLFQEKPEALCLQGLKNTLTSSFSFSKPETSALTKRINPLYPTVASTTNLHPNPPPATPVVRPRRGRQEELKPVVVVLPPVHFPEIFPPQHKRSGFSPNINLSKWRFPAQTVPRSSSDLYKDFMVKSQPLF